MNVPRSPEAVSRGLVGLGPLPAFELPVPGGRSVRSWDYRGRRSLVLWLAGTELPASDLAEAVACEPKIRSEGAELLVVVLGPLERAEAIHAEIALHGPILADPDGRVHARVGAGGPALLVTDRNGTIYWRAPLAAGRPDFAEALSWLGYLNILEPECGTCEPAWPGDLYDASS